MQSFLDSLCRCFGEPVIHANHEDDHIVASYSGHRRQRPTSSQPAPTTPDAKRRTKTMKLQEEQWDALFDCNAVGSTAVPCKGRGTNRNNDLLEGNPASTSGVGKPPAIPSREDLTVEQAQAVAKAKLAVGGSPQHQQTPPHQTKRKRASPEDIFRSRKNTSPVNNGSGSSNSYRPKDPFSTFLSNNPVLANSLCFATPVRDPADDEEPDIHESNSFVSDTNTLNTAEDTITSTLYYEQVKLAGLKQKNPPMPLFGAYEVKPSDDIRKVATCESYSSAMMKDWVLQNPEMLKVEPLESNRRNSSQTYHNRAPPKTILSKKKKNKRLSEAAAAAVEELDSPPDMVNSSSESTGRSV